MSQVFSLCSVTLKSAPSRFNLYLVVVIGVAGVVGVLLAVLAISGSLVKTIAGSGRNDRAVILNQAADSEIASLIERRVSAQIHAASGIRRTSDGQPVISSEVLASMLAKDADSGRQLSVVIRGTSATVLALRPEMKLVTGRAARPGFYEMIVGEKVSQRVAGLQLNRQVRYRDADWSIVGIFTSGGDTHEMELVTDAEILLSTTHRNAFNSVSVLLQSEATFRSFKDALTADPALQVKVFREADYYRLQSEPLKDTWSFVAYVVSGIMALGAMLGAANTMYSIVSARRVELATLRALGFAPSAILISILVEAAAFATAGALLGAAIVWLLFGGHTFSSRVGAGRVVAQVSIDFSLTMLGLGWGCAISVLGTLVPTLRELQRPVAAAARAV
jgi:putative ABC transport system permease protein